MENLTYEKNANSIIFRKQNQELPAKLSAKKGQIFGNDLIIDDTEDKKLIETYEVSILNGELHFASLEDGYTTFLNDFYYEYQEVQKNIKEEYELKIESQNQFLEDLKQESLDENLVLQTGITRLLIIIEELKQQNLEENLLFHTAITKLSEEMYFALDNKDEEISILSTSIDEKDTTLANKDKETASLKEKILSPDKAILATENGNLEALKSLLDAGVNVNTRKSNGMDLLTIAVSKKHGAIAEMLINRKANLRNIDDEGETALNWAVRNSMMALVEKLLNAGANYIVNHRRFNSYEGAVSYAHDSSTPREMLALLKRFGAEM